MLKNLTRIALVAALVGLPAAIWAQRGFGPGQRLAMGDMPMGGGQWWNHPEIQKKLDLKPEQIEALGKQRLETQTRLIDVNAKSRIARLELQELVRGKDVGKEDIDKKINEISGYIGQQIHTVVDQTLALRKILDPSQLEKIEKFIEQRKARGFRGPEGNRGPGGRGPEGWRGRDGRGPDGPPPRRGFGKGPGGGGGDPFRPPPPGGPGGRPGGGFGRAGGGPDGPPPQDRPEFGGPGGPPPRDRGQFGGPGGPPPRPDGDELGGFPPPPPPPPPDMEGDDGRPPEPGTADLPDLGEALDSLMADYNP